MQFYYRPWGFQEVEVPRFPDKRHMNEVRLSANRLSHGTAHGPSCLPWQKVTGAGHTALLFAHQPVVAAKVITLNTAGNAYLNASEVEFLGAFPKLRKANISSVMSVRLSIWNNSAPTGRIFMTFDIWGFFETPSRNFRFHENLTRKMGKLYENQYTVITFRSVLLRMKFFSDRSCRENQNTFYARFFFFRKSCPLRDNV